MNNYGTENIPEVQQTVSVPQTARLATRVETPKQRKWGWVAAGMEAVVLFTVGALIWHTYRLPIRQAKSARVSIAPTNHVSTTAENVRRLTPQVLSGREFRFGWKTKSRSGSHGILIFHSDGTLGGSGAQNPNESLWSIDQQGRLIFKHRDGRVSTIFTRANQQNGKWSFAGPFQFRRDTKN